MPVYSHSKLATYENCPRQFKLHYIDRIKPPDSKEGIEAFLGIRVHDTLEKLYKELVHCKLNSLDDLLKFYRTEWKKNYSPDTIAIVRKGLTEENYYTTGIRAISDYYRRSSPFDQTKTIATEMMITVKIGAYTIRGFIDRLSCKGRGYYEIHDYKTSGSLPAQDKMDADRQLALYQIGVREKFRDAKDVRLIWHYLLFDKDIISQRTDAQLNDLKKQIVSQIKTIEKDTRFEPAESKLCDWCDFPEYCPAKKHEFKLQALPANTYLKEKGVSLVNKYASIKAKIRDLQDQGEKLQMELDLIEAAAIDFARKEGISKMDGSDHFLRISEEATLSFPKSGYDGREELERCIKKAGVWEDVSGLNIKRLLSLIDGDAIANKKLDKILEFAEEVVEVQTRLGRKKGGVKYE